MPKIKSSYKGETSPLDTVPTVQDICIDLHYPENLIEAVEAEEFTRVAHFPVVFKTNKGKYYTSGRVVVHEDHDLSGADYYIEVELVKIALEE